MEDFYTLLFPTLPLQDALLLIGAWILSLIVLLMDMRPKRFYIVRHGQTVLNQQHIKQGAEGALSEHGRMQAKHLGIYFKQLPVRTILTSPYERAVETAKIIKEQVRARLIIAPLLAERRNPHNVIGKKVDDPEVLQIVGKIEAGYHEDNFRYADEENFSDMKKRAAKCLRYLERSPGDLSVVVTHHALLQMLLSYLLYRRSLNAKTYVKLAFFNPAENAGVTIVEYHPWKSLSPTHGWEVIAYNESIE